jgi:hypothetical protein
LKTKHLNNFYINFINEVRGGITFEITLFLSDENGIEWNQSLSFLLNNYWDNELNFNPDKPGTWKLEGHIIASLRYILSKDKKE